MTTAGNASGINDGAAALVVASRDAGDKAGVKPMARACLPRPSPACRRASWASVRCRRAKKALERAGLELKDMDVIEINEALCGAGAGLPQGPRPALDDPARQSQRRRDRRSAIRSALRAPVLR